MNEKYIIYGSIAVVAAVILYVVLNFAFTGNSVNVSVFQTISSGTTETGDVSIELTPSKNDEIIEVNMAVNTHSVDLNKFDLKQIITMEYDGKLIKPVSAPRLTGHHASGKLIFNAGKNINRFKIMIKGIPQINERIFEW